MRISENLLAPLIAGAFGLAPHVFEWMGGHAQRRARAAKLSDLRAELDFLHEWHALNGGTQPAAVDPRLPVMLQRLMARYEALHGPASPQADVGGLPWIRRALLLYRAGNARARRYHAAFHVVLLACAALLVSNAFNPTYDPSTGTNQFWFALVGALVLIGPVLWLLHALALRAAR